MVMHLSICVSALKVTLIMIVYLLVLLSCCNQLESTSTDGLQVFKDFLDYNSLQQAIIICNDKDFKPQLLSEFKDLITHYRVQFLHHRSYENNIFQHLIDTANAKLAIYFQITYNDLVRVESKSYHQNHIKNVLLGNGKFRNSLKWFISLNITGMNLTAFDSIRRIFSNVHLNLDADVTIAIRPSEDSVMILYDVYKVCHSCGTPVEIEFKGNWSGNQGLYIDNKFSYGFMVRRRNFRNITMNVTTILGEVPQRFTPLEFLDNDVDEIAISTMQRKTYQIAKPLQSLYNFRFNIVLSTDWGLLLENGSWTGIVDLISSHKADFSICPFRPTTQRLKVIDHTVHVNTERLFFVFRHPTYGNLRNIFLEPLSNNVWWCILAIIFLASFILFCHIQCEYHLSKLYQNSTNASKWDFVVLTILEAVLMQGPAPSKFRLLSARAVIITLCLFTMLMLQFYDAYIVGSLLTEPKRWITTLESLYQSNLNIGMEDIAYNNDVIAHTNHTILLRLYTERICKNAKRNIFPVHLGAARIADTGFAFATSDKIYFLLKDILSELQYCELHEVIYLPPVIGGFMFPKASPYRQHIQYTLLKMHSGGLIQRNDLKWKPDPVDCNYIRNHQVIEVDLNHFVFSIIFLSGMMLASLFILSIEILYRMLRRKQPSVHRK